MVAGGNAKVGRVSIEFVVGNYMDVELAKDGKLDPAKVRQVTIPGIVDSGATRLVLPESLAQQLGLRAKGKTKVTYANGHTELRDVVGGVYVKLLDRDGDFSAVVEPNRQTALIGAIVLEDLDFLIDCGKQKLVPRDPEVPISEIE
jgi:predicted aspartyl protease